MRKLPNSGVDCPHMRRKPARKAGFLVAGSVGGKSAIGTTQALGHGPLERNRHRSALGVTVFDNIGLGISAGIPIGVAGSRAMPRK